MILLSVGWNQPTQASLSILPAARQEKQKEVYWWDYLILPSEKTLRQKQRNDEWYSRLHQKAPFWKNEY